MARRSKLGQWTSSASAKSEVLSPAVSRSEEHTSELQSPCNLVCRLLLEKKKTPEHHIGGDRLARPMMAATRQPPASIVRYHHALSVPPHPTVRDLRFQPTRATIPPQELT